MKPLKIEFEAFGPYVGHEEVDFETLSSIQNTQKYWIHLSLQKVLKNRCFQPVPLRERSGPFPQGDSTGSQRDFSAF